MSDTKINNGGGTAFPAFIRSQCPHTGIPIEQHSTGMSLRQYAAIKLRVPDSGLPWLDKMIVESKRDEFAGQALAGMCGTLLQVTEPNFLLLAKDAYTFADAMPAARNDKRQDERLTP